MPTVALDGGLTSRRRNRDAQLDKDLVAVHPKIFERLHRQHRPLDRPVVRRGDDRRARFPDRPHGPLANAWDSGAWSWTQAQRVSYANDLADQEHLVPILASENESKGDSGPDQWRPPSQGAWCLYALVWDHIKAKWNLSVTLSEWGALEQMAATC